MSTFFCIFFFLNLSKASLIYLIIQDKIGGLYKGKSIYCLFQLNIFMSSCYFTVFPPLRGLCLTRRQAL